MGAGADEERPLRRQAHQLAADQASRRILEGRRRRRRARGRTLRRLRPQPRGYRRRQGQGADAIHDDEADRQGSRRCGIPTRALRPTRAQWQGSSAARPKGKTRSRTAAPLHRKAERRKPAHAVKVDALPDFVAPQLCNNAERPPSSDGWVHEIKFDGYRMQMRIEDGEVSLKTRKALDWTDKFPAIAKAAASCPTPSSTAKSSR